MYGQLESSLARLRIKEWNEDNFNVHINNFTLQAYQMKKWAFVSDYARLHIYIIMEVSI